VLNRDEITFIEGRRRFVRAWKAVGTVLLLAILALGAWLVAYEPLLANPFVVLARLEAASIPEPTLILMAGLVPVLVLTSLVLCIAIVLFAFAAYSNERRYLGIVSRTVEQARAEAKPGPATTATARGDETGD
jgi:hypothetical protein